jgi:SNF2 family DNA or RNA helicase
VYNEFPKAGVSLVVCPTSLVYNWLDEAIKFTPELKVEHITNTKSGFDGIAEDTQLVIISYGMMANLTESKRVPAMFYYLILDESQNIKNPAAKRTKSICKVNALHKLALS